jgi:Protein of unknown function (DUF5818)
MRLLCLPYQPPVEKFFMLKSLKRELLLFAAISLFAILWSVFWGGPFISRPAGSGAEHIQTQDASSTVFEGDIFSDGRQFFLDEDSGKVLRIDDPRRARQYVGKLVTVTGYLGARAKTIHIEQIGPAA